MTSHSLLLPLANCRKEYQHVKVMNKKYYTVCDSPKVNTLLRALARKVGGSGFWNLVLRKCQNNYQIYGEVAGSDPIWYIKNWFLPWLPSVYPGRYLKLVLNNFLSHYPLLFFYLPLHCFMPYSSIKRGTKLRAAGQEIRVRFPADARDSLLSEPFRQTLWTRQPSSQWVPISTSISSGQSDRKVKLTLPSSYCRRYFFGLVLNQGQRQIHVHALPSHLS